jgi:signal recognition particle subunit SRP54
MLDNLTQRLGRVVKNLRGQARLTEDNISDMLREVRMALLEADVALPVVKDFIARVKEKALGQEVIGSLTPGQALVGVVPSRADRTDGRRQRRPQPRHPAAGRDPDVRPAGRGQDHHHGQARQVAQGAAEEEGADGQLRRLSPAAIEQLKAVSAQAGIDFFPSSGEQKPADIAAAALDYAKRHYYDVIFVDTAGRLAIDEAMMAEIKDLHALLKPIETLFVVDAMLGQDAVNTAKAFNEALPLTGVILTKLDGDSRGGAALSVRHVTGKPIKFAGVGEKLTGLEEFHPERMASRILGMGDILGLVEEAQRGVDQDKAQEFVKKMKSGKGFDLHDFKEQIGQMKNMGGMSAMLDKLPAQFGALAQKAGGGMEDKAVRRLEGIINSMTPTERSKPEIIKANRKRRIATGAGVSVQEVNRLLNQFEQTQKMMKQFSKGGMAKMMRGMKGMLPGMR